MVANRMQPGVIHHPLACASGSVRTMYPDGSTADGTPLRTAPTGGGGGGGVGRLADPLADPLAATTFGGGMATPFESAGPELATGGAAAEDAGVTGNGLGVGALPDDAGGACLATAGSLNVRNGASGFKIRWRGEPTGGGFDCARGLSETALPDLPGG